MSEIALDRGLRWESETPDSLWMTQPTGGGAVKEFTWKEGMDEARRMASHLRSLDLPEKSNIAIFSKNSAWWILADLAIWMAGHVSVPLYPTLTPDTIKQILEHSGSKLIFVGKLDGYAAMAPGIPEGLSAIEMPLAPDTGFTKWSDLVGKNEPLTDISKRSADEMATIVYTSGSTGAPKGVMISFGAMATAIKGLSEHLGVQSYDRMLSYLPLAHVFERWVVETGTLWNGNPIFFAESLNTFVADLRRARPTLFISVPRLWQKFQQGVSAKMPPEKLAMLLKIPIVKGYIRKKVLSGLGLECVRFAGSGSAPIPGELIDWYRALGLELLEGYGMTENFCYSHVATPGQVRVGYVGSPYPGVECKLSDAGEILIKGPGSMMGYYKNEEATAASFDEDGFLMTGDRGEIDGQGRLRITGRVKELFKTSKGKYVAPAPIEVKLLLQNDIEMACVSGSGQPQPYGLVVLSEAARKQVKDDSAKTALAAALEKHMAALNSELDHHEQLNHLVVIAEEWSVENGMLTPTMKLKRGVIEDTAAPEVQGWYEKKEKVIWHG